MKIAVLASGRGEKALHVYNFFKEGNRVEVDCLVSDKENSIAQEELRRAGVETFTFPRAEWEGTGDSIARFLKSRGVEIIMLDELESPLPPRVAEEFGKAVITPSSVEQAPGEVVSLYNHLKYAPSVKKESRPSDEPSTPEEEWAEVLKIEYDPEEAARRATPPPLETPTPPELSDPEATMPEDSAPEMQNPVPPVYPPSPGVPVPPQGPQYSSAPQRQTPPENEPMPDNYLLWAVLATILCCMIPGIVAIVFSANVSSRYYAGDIEGAKRASKRAQIWIIVAVVTGIIWGTLYLPLMLLTS